MAVFLLPEIQMAILKQLILILVAPTLLEARPGSLPQSEVQTSGSPVAEQQVLQSGQEESIGAARQRAVSKDEIAAIRSAFKELRTDPATAASLAAEILDHDPVLPDRLRAFVYWIRGSGQSLTEDHRGALRSLITAEKILRQHEDHSLLRRVLRYKAASSYECGLYNDGKNAAEEAIEISKLLNDDSTYVSILYSELANNEVELGNTASAVEHLHMAIGIAERNEDHNGRLQLLNNLGNVMTASGFHEKAAECYNEVIESDSDAINSLPAAAAHAGLGDLLVQSGHPSSARKHLKTALELCSQPGAENVRAIAEGTLGNLELAMDNPDEAKLHYKAAQQIFEQLDNPTGVIDISQRLRRLESSKDIELIRKQINTTRENGASEQELSLLYEIADRLKGSGKSEEAYLYLLRAAELEKKQGHINLVASVKQRMARMDQTDLEKLHDEVSAKLDALESHRWWTSSLLIGVISLLIVLVAVTRLLVEKRRAVNALRVAHSELSKQKARQLQVERQLAKQQKSQSLESMASGIAHDFNNLLTGIAGLAELADNTSSSEEKSELLRQITSTSIEASSLTGQLSQFLGQPTDNDTHCDLRTVVDSTVLLLESICRPRQLQVIADSTETTVQLDDTRLRQIMVNLVSNAAEATSTTGALKIRIMTVECTSQQMEAQYGGQEAQAGVFHKLQMIDDGHGLSNDERMRIFDPYFSTRGVGRGLGLSSVAGIVRSVGGFICVDSAPGEGCCFSIHLPAIDVSADAAAESDPEVPHEQKPSVQPALQILVVDDESLILDLQKLSLSQAGMQVTAVSSAEQALRAAAEVQFKFDCVVTDFSMPGQNGRWLAQQLKTKAPDLPIILCSGFVDGSVELGREITQLLSKPYTQHDLLDAIYSSITVSDRENATAVVAG
ncbi:MAG: tetratricopeptide repeat protein [Fuerstiella sp.]|nr:tetratricopeptide repeat protein [Fuerstiella sp.]MCP4507685.1 tetratricopeptide repeat protein [Fuerstiella sp.]